jgi:hypothetical protein
VADHALTLTLLPDRFAICRFPAEDPVPAWTANARAFLTISRTPTELSIVADEDAVPDGIHAERGYRLLRVEGPLPLDLVGVFVALGGPLAQAGVPIFPIATYDTDYVFVRDEALTTAVDALSAAGHAVVGARPWTEARPSAST